jgi:hypothetical protein
MGGLNAAEDEYILSLGAKEVVPREGFQGEPKPLARFGSAVQCSAVRCGAVRCSAVRYGAVQCSAVRCGAVRCSAVRCAAVRCSAHWLRTDTNVVLLGFVYCKVPWHGEC